MKYRIDGTVMQTVTVEFGEGEGLFAQSGGMVWMSDNVTMKTEMRGGLGAGLGRMLSGESLFLVSYTAGGRGFVTFSGEAPGKILAFELKAGESLICQKDAFLAAQEGAKLDIYFKKKLGVGLFGGEGFILQKVTGPGLVFVSLDGEVVETELGKGQRLKVDTGCIAIMDEGIKYEIEMVKGVTNMLFGGEGLFLATCEGPGRVWLQSMPLSTLAGAIRKFLPKG